jgi:hypothetical protein
MTMYMGTTKIAAEKTVNEISKLLARSGARAVLTEYDDDGNVTGVCFKVQMKGQFVSFSLPARADAVLHMLTQEGVLSTDPVRRGEQAERTAWRQILRWIEAQMALIETGQVQLEEIFLPFAVGPDGKTVFQKLQDNNFKTLALPDGES